jgi:hypothetical protein
VHGALFWVYASVVAFAHFALDCSLLWDVNCNTSGSLEQLSLSLGRCAACLGL